MEAEPTRKLSTIVFTDIVGYSEMMNRNEIQAMKMLEFHDRIAGEIFTSNHGQIIKKLGDGILAVFNSVRDAYSAAKLFGEEIKEFNTAKPVEDRLLVRTGIHVGNVLYRDGDIFGNDVNVAARLQQICIPGGVCLSQSAHTSLGKSFNEEFKIVSNVKLKNIAENYTVAVLPSIYPDEFPIEKLSAEERENSNIVIHSITKIPPEKFSFIDALIVAVGLMIVMDFSIVNMLVYVSDLTFNAAILKLSNIWMLAYNIVFIGLFTISLLRDAVEIKFEDVRGADKLLSYIIQRFGFKPPVKKGDEIIFKPTFYNLIMWSTQKMRVSINGNYATISGSFLFLRKVKKMLRSYQK